MTNRSAEASEIARKIRSDIRAGTITDQTSGMAPGFAQGNLVVLPKAWASDFLRFCLANPKPCPLLAVGEPGDPSLPTVGEELISGVTCHSIGCFATGNWSRKWRISAHTGPMIMCPS